VTCLPPLLRWSSKEYVASRYHVYVRIGSYRLFTSALWKRLPRSLKWFAINELSDIETIKLSNALYTTACRFPKPVIHKDQLRWSSNDDGDACVFPCATPNEMDWASLELDMVIECSGKFFLDRYGAQAYLECGGAEEMLLSQARRRMLERRIVYGFLIIRISNHKIMILSRRPSCTTIAWNSCIWILLSNFWCGAMAMTQTIHSAMNDPACYWLIPIRKIYVWRAPRWVHYSGDTGLAKKGLRAWCQTRRQNGCNALRVPTLKRLR